jgi:hypothetical protein
MTASKSFTSEFRHHTFGRPDELKWLLDNLRLNNEISCENTSLTGYNIVVAQLDSTWSRDKRMFIIEKYDGTKILYDEISLRYRYLRNEFDDSCMIANLYASGKELYAMKELRVTPENYKPTTESILRRLGYNHDSYTKFDLGLLNVRQTKMTQEQLYKVMEQAESSGNNAILVDLNTIAIVVFNIINIYTMQKKIVFNS